MKKALEAKLEGDEASRCRAVCSNDEKLWQRVRPFAGLLREDTFGYPVVIRKGSVFVTAGTDRRSSGTHYTPRSLTEPIVQYTLEPLVYVGPAEGKPKEEWTLRSAREILSLKVCDMACGSGAFLVQACRYLAERLALAYTLHQQEISNGIYCRLTGADSRVATDELRDLVAKGLLLQTGTRRWTTYRLSPRAAQAPEEEGPQETGVAGRRMVAAERQERICQLIGERGTISARSISTELGIPRATIKYDLRKLAVAGRVERTSDDPKDPRNEYRLPQGNKKAGMVRK